jgi:hypothetical protein
MLSIIILTGSRGWMTKEELIYITLKQLSESFKLSPECFQVDQESASSFSTSSLGILWRFRVEVDGKNIPDPNNANRSVVVTYNETTKQLSCLIYFRDVDSLNRALMPDAESTITLSIPIFSRSYRKFYFLRKKILKRKLNISGMDYLSKLRSIFPTTHDDELLS